ncbi:MAG: hypothetical protein Q9163_006031 [Psora crenata]
MDEAICYADARGWLDTTRICVITNEAIERRIACLELQDNDYFRSGMLEAVAQAEVNGFAMTPFNSEISTPRDASMVGIQNQNDIQLILVTDAHNSKGVQDYGHRRGNSNNSGIRMLPRTPAPENEVQEVASGVGSMITESTSSSSISPKNMSRRAPNEDSFPGYPSMASDRANDRPFHDLSNMRTPSTSSATAKVSRSPSRPSTAISTPANPNFSVPLSGSPSSRKHRPQPLVLGNENNNSTNTSHDSSEIRGGMGLRERMKARIGGKQSPRLVIE